jgi:hypothetical protein
MSNISRNLLTAKKRKNNHVLVQTKHNFNRCCGSALVSLPHCESGSSSESGSGMDLMTKKFSNCQVLEVKKIIIF